MDGPGRAGSVTETARGAVFGASGVGIARRPAERRGGTRPSCRTPAQASRNRASTLQSSSVFRPSLALPGGPSPSPPGHSQAERPGHDDPPGFAAQPPPGDLRPERVTPRGSVWSRARLLRRCVQRGSGSPCNRGTCGAGPARAPPLPPVHRRPEASSDAAPPKPPKPVRRHRNFPRIPRPPIRQIHSSGRFTRTGQRRGTSGGLDGWRTGRVDELRTGRMRENRGPFHQPSKPARARSAPNRVRADPGLSPSRGGPASRMP
ncbi:hypothetical protein UG55_1010113 [Frankia sp. EI5c]|nr:hypothetical protein UG55_1010113 [Frankia sp. EI5c]